MTPSSRSGRRSRPTFWALVAVLSTTFAGLHVAADAPPAAAADLSQFNPGLIITDANFTDHASMSTADVQAFLDQRAPRCVPGADGTPCLRTATFDTTTRTPDDRCPGGYVGASGESAAQVITKVAQGCGISPRVLLVTLQKEQSLVTATGSQLYASRYQKAMGFACPDTAPCDVRYYGFQNQLYQAAWQFRNYALNPGRYAHRAGVVNNVRFHPRAECGSSPVLIQNQATAGLYNYTPYQPNAAALTGSGDSCSSYGNRNFWNFYTDWFGRPDGRDPIGVVDSVTATNAGVTVTGWTLDPDSNESTQVHVYVDGVGVSAMADAPRPDVGAAYGRGDLHGFSVFVAAPPGTRNVCTFGISAGLGPNTLLDCRNVVVPDSPPIGMVTSISTTDDSLTVRGWAIDPDTSERTQAHVYVDGVGASVWADESWPGLDSLHRRGDDHGFTHARTVAPGPHQVCAFAINTAAGSNTLLDCRTVVVGAQTAPIGVLDSVRLSGSELTVEGWTLDPNTLGRPTEVHIYVDGVGVSILGDGSRPDVATVFGADHRRGFSHTRAIGPGRHSLCIYAIDTTGGPPTVVTCRTVDGPVNQAPTGAIESVAVSGADVTVRGWTWDPDTTDRNQVHIYVDGQGVSLWADESRPDVAAAHGTGPSRGYTHTRTLPPGPHQVCVFSIDTGTGPSTLLGCRSFVTG